MDICEDGVIHIHKDGDIRRGSKECFMKTKTEDGSIRLETDIDSVEVKDERYVCFFDVRYEVQLWLSDLSKTTICLESNIWMKG